MRILLATAFAAIALAGCSASSSTEVIEEVAVAINERCPIMDGKVKDDGGRTDYLGETIGFCCSGCIDDFNALDEAGKASALASVDVTIGN